MSTPRVLIMTAAGNTGMPIALQLLREGFPVTALVRRADARSDRLQAAGADVIIGSMTDITDMRKAMTGVQRAYFCTPPAAGDLKAAAIFTAVAAEQHLEAVVAMSQWLASPNHPALHTREVWLADRMMELLPGTAVTFINPGFFADNDLQVLPFVAQFGVMPLPYGMGQNAPPSNEDMARVAAAILAKPAGHAGKTYRPTGPRLLTPQDLADTYAKVLGRRVRYINMPLGPLSKVLHSLGLSNYPLAMYQEYAVDYQKNAFAVNAPTDVVARITGNEAEDFETIVRRYVARTPQAKRRLRTQLQLILILVIALLRPRPRTSPSLDLADFSHPTHAMLSADSAEWQQGHTPTDPDQVPNQTGFAHQYISQA